MKGIINDFGDNVYSSLNMKESFYTKFFDEINDSVNIELEKNCVREDVRATSTIFNILGQYEMIINDYLYENYEKNEELKKEIIQKSDRNFTQFGKKKRDVASERIYILGFGNKISIIKKFANTEEIEMMYKTMYVDTLEDLVNLKDLRNDIFHNRTLLEALVNLAEIDSENLLKTIKNLEKILTKTVDKYKRSGISENMVKVQLEEIFYFSNTLLIFLVWCSFNIEELGMKEHKPEFIEKAKISCEYISYYVRHEILKSEK